MNAEQMECRWCGHFRDDPAFLETALPGLASLGSGYGSTRAADGLCVRHDRFAAPTGACGEFAAAAPATAGN